MKDTLQIAILGAFLVFCLTRLPREAFLFVPEGGKLTTESRAAFVELDASVQAQMLQQVHLTRESSVERGWLDDRMVGAEARILNEVLPLPEPLPLPSLFKHAVLPLPEVPREIPVCALRPETLAAPHVTVFPPAQPTPNVDEDNLLNLDTYESLKERK